MEALRPGRVSEQGVQLWEDEGTMGLTLTFDGLLEHLHVAAYPRDRSEDEARHAYLTPSARTNLTRVDVHGWPRRPAVGDRIQVERWDSRGAGRAVTISFTEAGGRRPDAAQQPP